MRIDDIVETEQRLRAATDLADIEIAACKMVLHQHDYYLYSWYRLTPGSTELEPLGTWNDGSHDALDASKERREAWPDAHDVTLYAIENELARRKGETSTLCQECSKLAYALCGWCGKPICYSHFQEGDFEEWCLPCWYEHVDMLRVDGNIEPEDYQMIQQSRTRKGDGDE